MCGRFVAASPPAEIAAYFGATLPETLLPSNYNVAPTTDVYAVVHGDDGPQMQVFHWGLVPAWATERKIGSKMINARGETISDKPVFSKLFSSRRCIIPADGFFEWKSFPGLAGAKKPRKQPYFIHRLDGEPLAMAGIWSTWRDPTATAGERLHSTSIVTTAANDTMLALHDRMPVILPVSAWSAWLDPLERDLEWLKGLLVPAPNELLTFHPVSPEVNSVRNGGAELIVSTPEPTEGPAT